LLTQRHRGTPVLLGNVLGKVFSSLWGGNKEIRILILGLDGAGKTTLLYRLQVCSNDYHQVSTPESITNQRALASLAW